MSMLWFPPGIKAGHTPCAAPSSLDTPLAGPVMAPGREPRTFQAPRLAGIWGLHCLILMAAHFTDDIAQAHCDLLRSLRRLAPEGDHGIKANPAGAEVRRTDVQSTGIAAVLPVPTQALQWADRHARSSCPRGSSLSHLEALQVSTRLPQGWGRQLPNSAGKARTAAKPAGPLPGPHKDGSNGEECLS